MLQIIKEKKQKPHTEFFIVLTKKVETRHTAIFHCVWCSVCLNLNLFFVDILANLTNTITKGVELQK